MNTQGVSRDCHVLSSHLKEADYKCGYVLLFHYNVLTFPKSRVSWWLGTMFLRPPSWLLNLYRSAHSETMWLLFTLTYPSQEGVKDTTNGNLHQKFHNKMLWGRKQSYLYIWKYLNLIRLNVINLSVGGTVPAMGHKTQTDEGTTEKSKGSSSPFTRLTAYSTFCPSQAQEHNSK